MSYRSSTLSLYARHCPHALTLAEQRTPRDTRLFQPGIAAHAILETWIGAPLDDREDTARAVCAGLISSGRSFDGDPEPPMSPDDAYAGRDIALAYLARGGWIPGDDEGLSARAEVGLAMTREGRPCSYTAPDAYYRALIDVLEVGEVWIDEEPASAVVTTDWKSAWPTDATALDSLQVRGQAVLAWLHRPDVELIRRQVVNLRTGALHYDDVWIDEEGEAQLRRWRADILDTCAGAATTRTPRPGPGCLGCPYLGSCEPARERLADLGDDGEPEDLARCMSIHRAEAKRLEELLRELTAEEPITVGDWSVGWQPTTSSTLAEGGIAALIAAWGDESAEGLRGLIAAAKLGVTQARAVAGAIHRGRGSKPAREELLSEILAPKHGRRWGVWR